MKRVMFSITLSCNLGMFFIHAFNSNNPHHEIIQLTIDHNKSKVPHGMSGSAVLDTNIERVIGIISSSLQTEIQDLAIPVSSLIGLFPKIIYQFWIKTFA